MSANGSAKLRVAMVITAYLPHVGGAEKQLAALAPRLQGRGIEVVVLTRRNPGWKAFEQVDGTPVYRLPAPGPKATAALVFMASALRLLGRLKPDLIHAHELLSPATVAIAAKRLYGMPVVAKVLRGGTLGDLAKLHNRRGGERRIAALRSAMDAFITISCEIDSELAAAGVSPEKRVFIPNGVDVDRYRPATAAEKQAAREWLGLGGGPLAVFAGRFVPEKRIDYLVDLWPAVRSRYHDAELVLVGDGPELDGLRSRAGAGIHFPGQVQDVSRYLQAADAFVLPSSTEGLSNSLLEAMAMGLACVATRVGGASDLIEHGRSGWLVPADDCAALEQGIVNLFAGEEMRQRMGQEARQIVAQEYGLDRAAERLAGLYARLTAAGLPGGAAYL